MERDNGPLGIRAEDDGVGVVGEEGQFGGTADGGGPCRGVDGGVLVPLFVVHAGRKIISPVRS